MSDDQSGWSPIIRFPDPSASFAHGFEAGRLWEQLKLMAPGQVREETVMADNRDLYGDLATHEKCEVSFVNSEVQGWLFAIFTKRLPVKLTVVAKAPAHD